MSSSFSIYMFRANISKITFVPMIPDLVEQATTCQRHFANILSFSNWSCAGNEDVAWRFECFEVGIRVESDDLCILGIIIGQRHSKRVRQNGERSWRLIC